MAGMFRLALAQPPGSLSGTEARLDWLASQLPEIRVRGADLLLLPELFAIGYNIGAGLRDLAEPADGPIAQSIALLARQAGIAIHYGFAECDGADIYNSAQCFGPDGGHLGGHRKLILPPGFERDLFTAGQGCTLFTYRGVRIATLICYDAEFGETVRHVAAQGAQLVLVPTALGDQWGWVAQRMIPTRGYENGVFLAYANSAGIENGLSYLGESVIAAPDGQELARAAADPQVIFADLDMAHVTRAQQRLPYLVDRAQIRLG
ncbi:MAG: putative amidohydrolase [Paracoccaceae bacterium]|jgi:predicted amidohydrolase